MKFPNLLLLGLIGTGFFTPGSDGISDDCDYIASMMRLVPTLAGNFFGCIADPSANFLTPSLKPQNFMCIIKCVLIKGGMLDEDGGIDAIGALDFLASILPPQLKEKAEDLVGSCQESSSKIDLEKDEPCLSYLPLIFCAVENLITIFGNGFVDTLIGKNPVNPIKMVGCVLNPPPPPGDEEGGGGGGDDQAAGSSDSSSAGEDGEPEAKRRRIPSTETKSNNTNNSAQQQLNQSLQPLVNMLRFGSTLASIGFHSMAANMNSTGRLLPFTRRYQQKQIKIKN